MSKKKTELSTFFVILPFFCEKRKTRFERAEKNGIMDKTNYVWTCRRAVKKAFF